MFLRNAASRGTIADAGIPERHLRRSTVTNATPVLSIVSAPTTPVAAAPTDEQLVPIVAEWMNRDGKKPSEGFVIGLLKRHPELRNKAVEGFRILEDAARAKQAQEEAAKQAVEAEQERKLVERILANADKPAPTPIPEEELRKRAYQSAVAKLRNRYAAKKDSSALTLLPPYVWEHEQDAAAVRLHLIIAVDRVRKQLKAPNLEASVKMALRIEEAKLQDMLDLVNDILRDVFKMVPSTARATREVVDEVGGWLMADHKLSGLLFKPEESTVESVSVIQTTPAKAEPTPEQIAEREAVAQQQKARVEEIRNLLKQPGYFDTTALDLVAKRVENKYRGMTAANAVKSAALGKLERARQVPGTAEADKATKDAYAMAAAVGLSVEKLNELFEEKQIEQVTAKPEASYLAHNSQVDKKGHRGSGAKVNGKKGKKQK